MGIDAADHGTKGPGERVGAAPELRWTNEEERS